MTGNSQFPGSRWDDLTGGTSRNGLMFKITFRVQRGRKKVSWRAVSFSVQTQCLVLQHADMSV